MSFSSRALTFTPIVPCALKLFASLVKDTEEQNGSAENLGIMFILCFSLSLL